MKTLYIETSNLEKEIKNLAMGDKVYLSGTVYTARDAAHDRIIRMINNNEPLPFQIENSVIYYAGPTPTPKGLSIGSCGPTTSKRMDPYTPKLLDMGLIAMIGKGERNDDVINSIIKRGAVYFCAIGGAGALYSKCIDDCSVVAFDDLGCESIKKLHLNNFPLVVAIDSDGNNIFKR